MTDATQKIQAPNSAQIVEQLADSLWNITEGWSDHAKQVIGYPLLHAIDSIGVQLAFTIGRTTVKQHLQHITNARKALIPVDYYLKRATKQGLIEQSQAEQIRVTMVDLAKQLDQHAKTIVRETNKKIAEQKQRQENQTKTKKQEAAADSTTESNVTH